MRKIADKAVVIAVLGEQVFAFSAHCPHMGGPMERCELDGFFVVCPLHGWRFDLRDAGRESHGYRNLCMLPVEVEANEVRVRTGEHR